MNKHFEQTLIKWSQCLKDTLKRVQSKLLPFHQGARRLFRQYFMVQFIIINCQIMLIRKGGKKLIERNSKKNKEF